MFAEEMKGLGKFGSVVLLAMVLFDFVLWVYFF